MVMKVDPQFRASKAPERPVALGRQMQIRFNFGISQAGGKPIVSRNEVRWERMFPDELSQAFAACPVVYFPYGLCEPHGPHCVLGLDALKAHGIVWRVARILCGP